MKPEQFVAKWSEIQQKETAVSQSHFNDVCGLVGHATPLEYDPHGRVFSFETQTVKPGGQKGFADVYFKGKFIWEYKGPHKDLEKAYHQLQLYREDLQNPPLLITSDIHTIVIHTNFNNYPTVRHTITFEEILEGDGLEKLRRAFFDPEKFVPDRTQEQITKATADAFLRVANEMKQHRQLTGEDYTPEQLAHFLVRLLFCLFAEDMGLLPDDIFTQIVKVRWGSYEDLQPVLRSLFAKMRSGGTFGYWNIRNFDGTLFDDDFVPDIPADLGRALLQTAEQDWSQVDPSIFGTLFERVIDEDKRAQLGAHYTSEADIMLIVEPVLMEPLRRRWDEVRRRTDRMLRSGDSPDEAHQLLADFAAELAAVRVLDPACGSGNFLYVALRQLLDLQKQVIAFAARRELSVIELTVSPEQLYGIEINPYAHELAQVTVWIGYLQWRHENGFGEMADPILRPLYNIRRMDAILTCDEDGNPTEPEWPEADVIVGNPPFLGGKNMRGELGDEYVELLRKLFEDRIPYQSDLVCYWFETARSLVARKPTKRAGLLATNSIRHGRSRYVLDRIVEDTTIFAAWSDKPWILEGAAVRVSIVCFGENDDQPIRLDGKTVRSINADLTSELDITIARRLSENENFAFQGPVKVGSFELPADVAGQMLVAKNRSGLSNANVIFPWMNGGDIVKRGMDKYIIDFADLPVEKASLYELPFKYVKENVKPFRERNRNRERREFWWRLGRSGQNLKDARQNRRRVIFTPKVSKHRVFVWASPETLPSATTIAITLDTDLHMGILQSKPHVLWTLSVGPTLEDRPTYAPTNCFLTFPFPWALGHEPAESEDERVAEIAHWARELVEWRDAWLNPPREGMYDGLGSAYEKMVKKRTLTNLYNGLVYYRGTVKAGEPFDPAEFDKVTRKSISRAEIQELDDIHTALDHAVLDAYGWPHELSDEEILERLLALNLERAGAQKAG